MTRRERIERKAARRREWAGGRVAKAEAAHAAVSRVADMIPMGQPILVGHHSERRARRDQDRIRSGMSRAMEHSRMVAHHEARAENLERALDRSIYSDDANAVEALRARIAKHEAERDRMKRVNSLYRKGDAAGLAAMGLDLESLRARVAAIGHSWVTAPYEGYQLTNLGARIRDDKKRLADLSEVSR